MKYNILSKILAIILIGLSCNLYSQVNSSFSLSEGDLTFERNDIYDLITTTENTFTEDFGAPQLPVQIESFVIPYEAIVTGLQINSASKHEISGEYYIYPSQPPRPLDGSEEPDFIGPNPDTYGSTEAYPGKTAEIISDEFLHGYHVVTVKIYPVEYIPATKKVSVQNVNFTINYSVPELKSSKASVPIKQSLRRAELASQFVKKQVKNASNVESCKNPNVTIVGESNNMNNQGTAQSTPQLKSTLSAIDELVPDYIIITNEELKPIFQQLANWKTQKGVPAIIKTVEEIDIGYPGSDLPERIRNYLKEAYSKWGASMYVLIGGDVNIVPARYVKGYCCPESPVDLYYATVEGTWNADNDHIYGEISDGVDYSYDFFLGRASVENISETQTFINKVIGYEKYSGLGTSNYVNNLLYLIGFLDKKDCGVYRSSYTDDLKDIAADYVPSGKNNWFVIDNFDCQYNPSDPYSTPYAYSPYRREACNPNKPTTNYVAPGGGTCHSGNQALSNASATSCMNNGGISGLGNFHIVYHLQHSGVKGMGLSQIEGTPFRPADFDGLTNGDHLQILFTGGCKPATFSKDCIGEHYINNPNGGGVAFIGNADYGYYGEHPQYQRFVDALYTTSGHPSTGYNLGFAFQKAPASTDKSEKKRLALLGDPEMPVWTATPQNLSVTVSPTTIASGENTIVVRVNNLPSGKKATICLQKGDEGYAKKTITSNGSYSFTFTPHTSGHVDVTVTAHNYKPFESTIAVNTNQNQSIYITNLAFNDDKIGSSFGNGDLQTGAGETHELYIDLKNSGASNASNVNATLTCSSPYITISGNQSAFGNISSGSTQTSQSAFVFTIDKDAPEILVNDISPVKFILQVTDNSGRSYADEFNIDIHTHDLMQGNKTVMHTSDGDNIIEPNETVSINIDLFNNGKAKAVDLTGVLSGNSPHVTNCLPTPCPYPVIEQFETETNTNTYRFTVSSSYSVGQALNFILTVKNEYGKTWTYNFDLLDRPAQIDVGSIDFLAYKKEIHLYWPHQSNVSGYNIYRSDADANGNEVGNYQKVNNLLVADPHIMDKELNELTKYYYKVSPISLTGNEGELSAPFLAWTSYPTKGVFPIEMDSDGTFRSSINVLDVNNDKKKEIFAGYEIDNENGLLVALNADGTELYDIDNNETTYSGFAITVNSINSTPAIGDLDSDGSYEVISTSGNDGATNYVYCYSIEDFDNNKRPDLLWDNTINTCYRGSVISNIDNSSDGSLEVVAFSKWGGIKIMDAAGSVIKSISTLGTYGAISVSDIDGDGDKEIIGSYHNDYSSGIYIWHHDGSDYGANQPYYTLSGYKEVSSIVVCDLDNNGDKEILTSALKEGGKEGRIVAIHHNGQTVSGWNGSQTISYPDDWHTQEISVGDLNNDGNLEVVAIGQNIVKVWNKSGSLISSSTISNLEPGKIVPILADIDFDPDIEIIFGSNIEGRIHAINMDGTKVLGFPLHMEGGIIGSACVADVDNNGLNEIIAASGNKMYMWETVGSSELIEWGSERHNSWNTGSFGDISTVPSKPDLTLDGDNIILTSENETGYIIEFYRKSLVYYRYKTVDMGAIGSISLDELGVDRGRINKIRVKAYNNVGNSQASEDLFVYLADCNEKNRFLNNNDLNSEADLQQYESCTDILAGDNLVLPADKTVVFSAKTVTILNPGFNAPFGSNFIAMVEGCTDCYKIGENETFAGKQVELNEEKELETTLLNDISIYPNPTTGNLIFNSNNNIDFHIKVMNLQGKVIVDERVKSNVFMIDISEQPKGLYLVEIQKGEIIETMKVILQ